MAGSFNRQDSPLNFPKMQWFRKVPEKGLT
jgi:hypothetical protein